MPRILLPPLLLLLLSGCAALLEEHDETEGWSAQKFYTEASLALADGEYETAIKYYQGLESRYPFGLYATQAQLDVAYAFYRDGQHEAAIAAANRFIKLHPRNPHVDYAYYLKGIVNFNRNMGLLTRYLPTDVSQRDPGTALDSFNDFSELLRRFPDSTYAEDARTRMLYLRNNLAMHEVHVARYYMKRGAYLAAANRCIAVIEKYQRTPAVEKALKILVQAYGRLGLANLAVDAERVLALNQDLGAFETQGGAEQQEPSLGEEIWNLLQLDRD